MFISRVARAFIYGVLTVLSIESLFQDWYGMEGYIQRVRQGWISSSITGPIAIIVLMLSIILYGRLLYKDNRDSYNKLR